MIRTPVRRSDTYSKKSQCCYGKPLVQLNFSVKTNCCIKCNNKDITNHKLFRPKQFHYQEKQLQQQQKTYQAFIDMTQKDNTADIDWTGPPLGNILTYLCSSHWLYFSSWHVFILNITEWQLKISCICASSIHKTEPSSQTTSWAETLMWDGKKTLSGLLRSVSRPSSFRFGKFRLVSAFVSFGVHMWKSNTRIVQCIAPSMCSAARENIQREVSPCG